MTDAPESTTEVDILPPYARDALDVVASARSDADSGLTGAEAAERLARLGPNQITGEPPPSVWEVAIAQLRDPQACAAERAHGPGTFGAGILDALHGLDQTTIVERARVDP